MGWVFFWNDKGYVDGGDRSYMPCGNEPIVVLRDTGAVQSLPVHVRPAGTDNVAPLAAFKARFDTDAQIRAFAESLRPSIGGGSGSEVL